MITGNYIVAIYIISRARYSLTDGMKNDDDDEREDKAGYTRQLYTFMYRARMKRRQAGFRKACC